MSRVPGACMSMLALFAALASVAHAQVADRYGPTAPAYDAAQIPAAAVLAGAPVRMLTWPGKVTPAPAAMAPPQGWAPASAPVEAFPRPRFSAPAAPQSQTALASVAPAPPAYLPATPVYRPAKELKPLSETQSTPASAGGPHYGLVQAFPTTSRAPQTAAAPTIYDDAAPPPAGMAQRLSPPDPARAEQATVRQGPSVQTAAVAPVDPAHPGWAPPRRPWAQAADQGVRFYSLHRQYGVTPDPAPIPPQFFAATADLGEPAGPMSRTVAGAGAAAQAARAAQAAAADTSSSQP